MTLERPEDLLYVRELAKRLRCSEKVIRVAIRSGELKSYTDLMNEARQEALDRMKQEAEALGANAVLNVRFSTSTITQGAAELLAYGTAVVVEESAHE